ncbi:DNA-binding LytR/AlgR family response regulator [Spirosoma lacussanchae]|uniref:LytTR family DNA-binding domain-containing protein n=1 Tax=Spirosoma lacussanchae TaxID=1884249 RepID=UPI001108955F|nr:LytTR family DNA-binding domain-containing protein [Spirosoma lacussanchae]
MISASAPNAIKLPSISDPVAIDFITYLEGYGNYTRVYQQAKSTPLVISQTLKWFEDQLPAFIRTHKSMMVNPSYVANISQGDDARTIRLKLVDGSWISVSRRRADLVRGKLTTLRR